MESQTSHTDEQRSDLACLLERVVRVAQQHVVKLERLAVREHLIADLAAKAFAMEGVVADLEHLGMLRRAYDLLLAAHTRWCVHVDKVLLAVKSAFVRDEAQSDKLSRAQLATETRRVVRFALDIDHLVGNALVTTRANVGERLGDKVGLAHGLSFVEEKLFATQIHLAGLALEALTVELALPHGDMFLLGNRAQAHRAETLHAHSVSGAAPWHPCGHART